MFSLIFNDQLCSTSHRKAHQWSTKITASNQFSPAEETLKILGWYAQHLIHLYTHHSILELYIKPSNWVLNPVLPILTSSQKWAPGLMWQSVAPRPTCSVSGAAIVGGHPSSPPFPFPQRSAIWSRYPVIPQLPAAQERLAPPQLLTVPMQSMPLGGD